MPDPRGRPIGRRRAIPAPFQRPAIDLDHHGRVWLEVPMNTLEPGDNVAGFGLLERVEARHRLVELTSVSGSKWSVTDPKFQVRAFVPAERYQSEA